MELVDDSSVQHGWGLRVWDRQRGGEGRGEERKGREGKGGGSGRGGIAGQWAMAWALDREMRYWVGSLGGTQRGTQRG